MLQEVKAEEPKLEQAAEKELTGAGGAGTTGASTAPTATPAGMPALEHMTMQMHPRL